MEFKHELQQWLKGCVAYDNLDYDSALRTFMKIGDHARMHFNIGAIFNTINDHRRAIAAYNKAVSLDPFLAIGYFQRGVSYFLLGHLSAAYRDFDETYQKLRGNSIVNYQQLGLAFRLYACEVLFNRGICQLYMGKMDPGLTDLYYAQRSKVNAEHEIIDHAVRVRGQGFSVYSMPPGVIYRPPENKLMQLEMPDNAFFAATDKLGRCTRRNNSILLKEPPEQYQHRYPQEDMPVPDSYDYKPPKPPSVPLENFLRSDDDEWLAAQRDDPQADDRQHPTPGEHGALPTPGPEHMQYNGGFARPSGEDSAELTNVSKHPPAIDTRGNPFPSPPPSSQYATNVPSQRGHDNIATSPIEEGTVRTHILPKHTPTTAVIINPTISLSSGSLPLDSGNRTDSGFRSSFEGKGAPPKSKSEKRYSPLNHSPDTTNEYRRSMEDIADVGYDSLDEDLDRVFTSLKALSNTTTPSITRPQRNPERLSTGNKLTFSAHPPESGNIPHQQQQRPQQPQQHLPPPPPQSHLQQQHFQQHPLPRASPEKLKIKAHYKDTRIIVATTDLTFSELVTRVRNKFEVAHNLRIQYKDEEGQMVTMIDQEDLDMARYINRVLNTKHKSNTSGPNIERLEIWCFQ